MSLAINIESYQLLESELGVEKAKSVIRILNLAFTQVEKKAETLAKEKKIEIRDEMSKELASKSDLALVKSDLQHSIDSKIAKLESKMTIGFVILACLIIFLNQNTISFIFNVLGLIK